MRHLRIEDIKENPWSVLLQPLPEHPTRHLLLIAQIAVTCCREIAHETILEFEATYGVTEVSTPELAAALDDWHRAHRKIGDICCALEERFGVPVFDFNLSREVRK